MPGAGSGQASSTGQGAWSTNRLAGPRLRGPRRARSPSRARTSSPAPSAAAMTSRSIRPERTSRVHGRTSRPAAASSSPTAPAAPPRAGRPGSPGGARVRSRGCSSRRGGRPPGSRDRNATATPTVCPAGQCPVVPVAAHRPRPGLRGGPATGAGTGTNVHSATGRLPPGAWRGWTKSAGPAWVAHPVPDEPQPAGPALGRPPRGRVQGREVPVVGVVPSTPTSASTWPRPSEPASRRRWAATWQRSRNTCAAPTSASARPPPWSRRPG
jgi:hypothetical protein